MRKLKTKIEKPVHRDFNRKAMKEQPKKAGPHVDRRRRANKNACDVLTIDDDEACRTCAGDGTLEGCADCGKVIYHCPDCIYDEEGDLLDKCTACVVEKLASGMVTDDEEEDATAADARSIWDED
jgi:hypothetical protein